MQPVIVLFWLFAKQFYQLLCTDGVTIY